MSRGYRNESDSDLGTKEIDYLKRCQPYEERGHNSFGKSSLADLVPGYHPCMLLYKIL